MTSAEAPVPMETLLTHREWVRRLARSLVHDDAAAQDVEQRTWLTVLRSPPYRVETARAWLARVVRSQASNALRDERRRGAREAAAARPEATRSTADVVAEAESHRRVVLAVMSLAEPYRSTVLLRWFEDLPPREVAARMGVPVETARTRLRRAHEAMRERLGGGGAACALSLAPLMVPRAGLVGAAKAAGGAIVGTKLAYTAAVVGVAFGAGMVVRDATLADRAPAADPAEVAALRERVQAVEASSRAAPAQAQTQAQAQAEHRGAAGDSGRKVASLEARADAQQTRIDALEKSLAAATARAAAAEATAARAATAAPAPHDQSAEAQRLKAMSDDELAAFIRSLTSTETRGIPIDGRAVLDACEILLARPLDPTKRADALIQKGIGHRVLIDRPAEETAFRDALAAAGPRTEGGRAALYQLAWTAARHGEHREAAEQFLALSQDADAPPKQRSWNRLHAAEQSESAGDKGRALAEYRAVVDEFGSSDDANARGAADQAKTSIARIEKASAR